MHELGDTPCAGTSGCLPNLYISGALNARSVVHTKLENRFQEGLARERVMVDSDQND